MLRKSFNANTFSLGTVRFYSIHEGEGRTLRALGFNNAELAMFLQTPNRFLMDMSHEHV